MKQTGKQVRELKSLDLSNKKDELKQIEGTFSKNMLKDVIVNKLKEIIKLQDIINTDGLYYNLNVAKFIFLLNIFCLLFLKRYT